MLKDGYTAMGKFEQYSAALHIRNVTDGSYGQRNQSLAHVLTCGYGNTKCDYVDCDMIIRDLQMTTMKQHITCTNISLTLIILNKQYMFGSHFTTCSLQNTSYDIMFFSQIHISRYCECMWVVL